MATDLGETRRFEWRGCAKKENLRVANGGRFDFNASKPRIRLVR